MTCNSNCYLPNPPRAWSRVQNSCSLFDDFQEGGQVKLPYSGKIVPASTLYLEYAMLNKGNVLQYKKNSSNLTKQQRYAQIAKGLWTNRNTTWATQSTRGYTNPNNQSLERANSINITLDGVPTTAPVTCPKLSNIINNPLPPSNNTGSANPEVIPPPPPPPTESSGTALPPAIVEPPIEPIVIRDLGTLVCGTQENVCTGEIIRQLTDIICHPTTDSDVPGSIMELCWNDGTPTWYPRQRYIMTNSANKWPVNATLLSAVNIPAPVIISITNIGNEVTITWAQDETCLPVSEFIIYEDGIPIKIVSGNTFTTNIIFDISDNCIIYTFYIIGTNGTIVSESSNSVSVTVCYSLPIITTVTCCYKTATISWTNRDSPDYYILNQDGIPISNSATSPYLVTNLTNGVTYTFTVTAVYPGAVEKTSASYTSPQPQTYTYFSYTGTSTSSPNGSNTNISLTSSGTLTYNCPIEINNVPIVLVGGGGGGGGGYINVTTVPLSTYNSGGGGGGGAIISSSINIQYNIPILINIGAGGTGGTGGGQNVTGSSGSNGATTTVSSLTAIGGGGGGISLTPEDGSGGTGGIGGIGGTGAGNGGIGGTPSGNSGNGTNGTFPYSGGGGGGGSILYPPIFGGQAAINNTGGIGGGNNLNYTGQSCFTYGGGGGGGGCSSSPPESTGRNGGNGGPGIVVFTIPN
jgi:hypothetical protein